MSENAGSRPVEKIKEAGRKAADALEPDEQETTRSGGPANASSPFSGGERPDEQPGGASRT